MAKSKSINALIDEKRLEQQKLADLEVVEQPPKPISGKEFYDPNFVAKPLERKEDSLYVGIQTLDEYLLGVENGKELVFMGAPSNIGKTTIALYIALQFACQGKKVFYMAAEDSREWMESLFNTIVKNNGLESGVDNIYFFAEEEAMRFIGKGKKDLVGFINALRLDYDADWFFLDMLNIILDPLEDKEFGEIIKSLRQNANLLGHSLWLNCRFREPRSLPKEASLMDIYSPDFTMFYGKSTQYMFSATKVLALTQCELEEGSDVRNLCIKILKNKRCKIGTLGTRHRVFIDGGLNIYQPSDAVLPSTLME